MQDEQLVQPNTNAKGTIGFCEEFAEVVWGSSATRPTALAGWHTIPSQYLHAGQEPPTDVAVQMYWSYQAAGHTATSIPGRGILSSPWELGTTQAWLSSRAELESIYSDEGKYPLTYLGWSEYFNGVLVAQEGGEMTESDAEKVVTYLYRLGTGDYPNPGQAAYWVPRVRDVATGVDELGTAMLQGQTPPTPASYLPYSGAPLFTEAPTA